MELSNLIPYPDPLPAPWWIFKVLLVVTFILHLLLANVLVGGIVFAWVNSLKTRRRPDLIQLDRNLAARFPVLIALSINLGVAPLLFLQVMYGQFIYVSSVLMAGYWISVFVLVILAYYAIYLYISKSDLLGSLGPWLLGLSGFLFLAVGYIFTNSLVLAINPGEWVQYFTNHAGGLLARTDKSVWPRFLHFAAASLALGGLSAAVWGHFQVKKGQVQAEDLVRSGLLWYGLATMANFVIGLLYLGALPNEILTRVIFMDKGTGFIFLLAVAAGLASVPAAFSRNMVLTVVSALISVVLMVVFRYGVRAAFLAPYLAPDQLPRAYQFSPLVFFLACFLAALGLIAYMLRLVWRAGKESRA